MPTNDQGVIRSKAMAVLFEPYEFAGIKIRNRFVRASTVNNLTDEDSVTSYAVPGTLGEIRRFGRQYYLGVNYRY